MGRERQKHQGCFGIESAGLALRERWPLGFRPENEVGSLLRWGEGEEQICRGSCAKLERPVRH
jgi:hypothetical protein